MCENGQDNGEEIFENYRSRHFIGNRVSRIGTSRFGNSCRNAIQWLVSTIRLPIQFNIFLLRNEHVLEIL